MADADATCRICRGEATPAQPLMHPCKCRGLIKYIHQDCLLEWLEHASGSTKKCDICATPYRFVTLYDPAMPRRMPMREIGTRLVLLAKEAVVKYISAALYVACVCQVPVYWKLVGRLCTYAADGRMPAAGLSLLHVVAYGQAFTSPHALLWERAQTFFSHTYVGGALQVVLCVFVLFVVFVEHEWVVREEGYTKLLLRHVGREPKTKLADLLGLLAADGADALPPEAGNGPSRELMAARALEYLQQDALEPLADSPLHDALANGQLDELVRRRPALATGSGPALGLPGVESDGDTAATPDDIAHVPPSEGLPGDIGGARPAPAALELDDSDEETAEELERRRNLAEDEMAVAEAANNNGNIFEVLGLRLQIATPIQLTFVVNLAVLVLLFTLYFLPHMMGSFVALVVLYALVGLHGGFIAPVLRHVPTSRAHRAYVAVFALDRATPPDHTGRFAFLAIGYAVVCFAICQLMAALTSGGTPITGNARRLYKVLFQMTATSKVFVIFAIEIVFFPAYCGWLIDFCLAPLLVSDIVQATEAGPVYHIFLTSAYSWTLNFIMRTFLYWMWGTAYMFCIALFVSMTRNHILRSGVLYFIKSPEDPNARLIHDAVVKPFFLQMLRILLSAKVYSAFVVFGIGVVTWGLRFLVNAPASNGALLPIKQFSIFTWQFALITGMSIFKAEPVITKYCRIFWKRAFAVLCHRLRLSHFLLGTLVPQERGHILYKNFISGFFKVGEPDYTKPVSYSEAMNLFKNDSSVTACFVPDGSYLRVPSSDDNSRKFLRELFVPVTKSDQLLTPIREEDLEDDTDWWDEEVVCEDTYTVVYSPPNFRTRSLALVGMVSIFGALLFIVILLLALIIGRPIFRAWLTFTEFNAAALGINLKYSETTDWSFADVNSLCVGLLTQLVCLLMFDSDTEGSVLRDFAANQRRRLAEPAANVRGLLLRAGLFMAQKLLQVWLFAEMHFYYVNLVESKIFGTSLISVDEDQIFFQFTRAGFVMHSVMALVTVIPMFTSLASGMPEIQSLRLWMNQVGLIPLLLGSVLVLAHSVYETLYGNLVGNTAKYVDLAIFGLVLAIRGIMSTRRLLRDISEQIKTEKYVRGTAVQNVEGADN
ncbi:hypothetical protein METBIDRAFT_39056 [Metschnikowia bicuspidata var. bicuspidata NRRL YB-4993]|uniref:RING-type E3 ubiquitin transferase n=1 Tax=Metschnikowia bicuspidata var. bicuspidata NRRL YB-4993 TaxID=869754 RepID=A0A1A0HDC4_9ASCO|nr:hypothetical protein METBIDRAFT_39056 [Metschnikowia bicuspidata var. bicuspidata NRRL YB-4993]OBA21897.1 hypothetical protein METBIDRAFT_39056 [Metschnikowia bicuspidata var. bicuspidata NRRL YB-4993]